MFSVHGAGVPLVALEETLPIKKINVGIAVLEGIPVGGEDDVPAMGVVLLIRVKIRAANQ